MLGFLIKNPLNVALSLEVLLGNKLNDVPCSEISIGIRASYSYVTN